VTERSKPRESGSVREPLVFIVEDDESMRRALSNLFQSVGLEAEVFGSTSEMLQSELPDVASCLVLDIRLPGLSGLDFQAALAKANIHIPIIFMTGHGGLFTNARCLGFERKPVLVGPTTMTLACRLQSRRPPRLAFPF
jgi:DNA-binding NtrC family response regulator